MKNMKMDKNKNSWEELQKFQQTLTQLAKLLPVGEILRREREIVNDANFFNISVNLPNETVEKAEYLQLLDQQIRIKKSGVNDSKQSIVITMNMPTGSNDSMAELVFNYDMGGVLVNAFTRYAERNGQRASIELDPSEALQLEELFKTRQHLEKRDQQKEIAQEEASMHEHHSMRP